MVVESKPYEAVNGVVGLFFEVYLLNMRGPYKYIELNWTLWQHRLCLSWVASIQCVNVSHFQVYEKWNSKFKRGNQKYENTFHIKYVYHQFDFVTNI